MWYERWQCDDSNTNAWEGIGGEADTDASVRDCD